MLRDLNLSVNGRRDSTDPRVGVLASEIPTGFPRPSFLLNDVDTAFPNRLYSVEILTLPSQGKLLLDKRGVGTFTDAPIGTYTGTQRVNKYDPGVGLVSTGIGNYSLTVAEVVPDPVVLGITVSPPAFTLAGGAQQQMAAIVFGQNNPSQEVVWSTTLGSISTSGVLTAPAAIVFDQGGTVTATSVTNPAKSSATTFTVPAAAVIGVPQVTGVEITPAVATVEAGSTQQFQAVVLGSDNPSQDVNWWTTIGTISATGLLTAPPAEAIAQMGTVIASSKADSSWFDTSTFIVPAKGVIGEPSPVVLVGTVQYHRLPRSKMKVSRLRII